MTESETQLDDDRLSLPRLIFGTAAIGNMLVATSDASKQRVIRSWLEHSELPIAIDTAGKYGAGLAAEVLGRELTAAKVAPNDVIISNKLGWRRAPLQGAEPTFEPGVWCDLKHDAVQDISGPGIRKCWKEGNELLGDYKTDLLSVHDPDEYFAAADTPEDRARRFKDVIDAFEELANIRDQEKLKGIGVGCKDWKVVQELDQVVDFDWVMIANSLTIMRHPPELLEFLDQLHSKGVHVINSAVLHGGFLSGSEFFDYKKLDPSNVKDAKRIAWRDKFLTQCDRFGVNFFDAAVTFGLAHPAVGSIALSSSKPERTKSMVDSTQATIPSNFWQSLLDQKMIQDEPAILSSLIR